MASGVARWPSSARAGSPGSARIQTNNRIDRPTRTGIINPMRRTTNRSMLLLCCYLADVGFSARRCCNGAPLDSLLDRDEVPRLVLNRAGLVALDLRREAE